MALTRWDPFNDLLDLQKRMNRMFEDSITRGRSPEAGSLAGGSWTPAVDIYETPENIVLLADLPGVDEGDLDVRVENSTLILSGERRMQKNVNEESFHRVERGHGAFSRSFTLPASIDQERIRAEHRKGILEVTLPKSEGSRPKKIAVHISR